MRSRVEKWDVLGRTPSIIIECDFAEASKEEFDIIIKSEAFGFKHIIYKEGITCEYYDKYHNYVIN